MATKTQIAEFTAYANDGYNGIEFNGLFTSPVHACWCIGRHLQETGRCVPHDVRPGRGDLVHANGMLWHLYWRNVKHPTITREQ